MAKLIVSEFPKWASKLNIWVRILGCAKYLISGNLIFVPKFKLSFWISGYLKWKISELISFHLNTIAKHVVSVTISGVPKLLVLMLVLAPLMFVAKLKVSIKFRISFQYSWNFVFSSVIVLSVHSLFIPICTKSGITWRKYDSPCYWLSSLFPVFSIIMGPGL